MKKLLSAVLVLGAVLCLAGCGNKPSTLVCSRKVGSYTVQLTSNFTGNKLQSMGLVYDMDYSSYSDTLVESLSKQDFCKSVSTAMSQYTLVNCAQKVENKHVIITSGIDMSKFSEAEKTGSPAATKEAMEKQLYTCELK